MLIGARTKYSKMQEEDLQTYLDGSCWLLGGGEKDGGGEVAGSVADAYPVELGMLWPGVWSVPAWGGKAEFSWSKN